MITQRRPVEPPPRPPVTLERVLAALRDALTQPRRRP